jgi:hypothetical protein
MSKQISLASKKELERVFKYQYLGKDYQGPCNIGQHHAPYT